MKILVVSEGKNEGSTNPNKPNSLCKLVIFAFDQNNKYEPTVSFKTIKDKPVRWHGKGNGHFKLAMGWIAYAHSNDFQAVVIVTDEDGEPERIQGFDEAQDHQSGYEIPRVLGVPVRTFDAWMLGDAKAIAAVLKNFKADSLPENPESESDPKKRVKELMKDYSYSGGMSDFYDEICGHINLQTLSQVCPKSFRPFLERLNRLS